ncbi:hypothetical protein [Alteribacter natronophilus]|uniref:hypothetical protein n=1 Tax=Alteribacter natronophilus TaxID=2583810 RepID=UPI00110E2F14|nr:hypothetical protein [Alteribacter natronophilus]TMW70981.1 hypothetical protein FGB90_13485 [Alteribacter natronophilus]
MQKKQVWIMGAAVLLFGGIAGVFFAVNAMSKGEVAAVEISELDRLGNHEVMRTVESGEQIERIVHAVHSTSELDGVVDFTGGDYKIALIYDDEVRECYHVWLNEYTTSGAVMNVEQGNALYELSETKTEELKELLLDGGL